MTVMAKRTKPKITSKTPIGKDVDLRHEDVRLPDGTRVTDELVDDIVEEVRRKGGRPSLTGDAAVSPRVTFRVTPGVRERAAIIAEREGKTISQLAREALEARVRAS
jgi:predicted HicB family RNase H-like nuclease